MKGEKIAEKTLEIVTNKNEIIETVKLPSCVQLNIIKKAGIDIV